MITICCVTAGLLAPPARGGEEAIGPGVAGQVHALAYDPSNPDVIYAGGDNCGVYKSDDHGETWTRWNEGLADDNPRMTSYVDDLLVVPSTTPGLDPQHAGVYAATRGGIVFRREGSASWEIQTADLTYDRGYAAGVGAAIPFNCLAFDTVSNTIYAGAGDGRITLESDWDVYPEVDEAGFTEYSLWSRCLDDSCATEPWAPVIRFGDRQTALQIAFVVNPNGTSRGVVATVDGVYLQTGNDWDSILDQATMCADFSCNYSHVAAGVGVGEDGVIWALTRREGDHDPGVYRLRPSIHPDVYVYDKPWKEPGESDDENVPPQGDATWMEIVHAWGDNDFKTLTVIPGTADSEDEVFVGMEPSEIPTPDSSYNGYFRYGECGDGETRWVNILYRAGAQSWNDPDVPFSYAIYTDSVVTDATIPEMGWLPGYATGSTVPLQVSAYEDPMDGDECADWMFASLYHYPLVMEFGTTVTGWEQRYCTGVGGMNGYYQSNGLNIMSVRSIDFTESGRLVVGCGDFVGFVTNPFDPSGAAGFRYMDPYYAAGKNTWDTEIMGDEIYMVRAAPNSWAAYSSPSTGWFGYSTIELSSGEACRQRNVIACYDESLDSMDGDHAGYRWRYISQGLDPFMPSDTTFTVVDAECVAPDVMFAIASHDGSPHAIVARGVRSAGTHAWTWSVWWDITCDDDWSGGVRKLLHLPGTDRLLMLSTDNECLQELSVSTSSMDGGFTPVVWLDRDDAAMDPNHRLTMSLKNLTNLACDDHGEWLYLTASGQVAGAGQSWGRQCANVLRAPIPAAGGPAPLGLWSCLVNDGTLGEPVDGIAYEPVDPDYWPDSPFPSGSIPSRVAENLPMIETVAIHPENPRRIFIGVRAGGYKAPENFHPNNGVWEYVPASDAGAWHQRKGDGASPPHDEPCKGIRALGLVPGDPSTLIAGSFGQEVFRLTGLTPSPSPVTAVTSLEPVHPDQTLLMLTLEPEANDVVDVWVDASTLGLASRLHLVDDGTGQDWAAGDGIWTASVADYAVGEYGVLALPVCARDADWNSFYGDVAVEVLETAPAQFFRNVSPDVDISYTGTPSGLSGVDLLPQVGDEDDLRDLVMSQTDDFVRLFQNTSQSGGVPSFLDLTYIRFTSPGEAPTADHGPTIVADLDNDGHEDLIVTTGASTTQGLRFYRRLPDGPDTGEYLYEGAWHTLTADQQTGIRHAVCADYDGDGYTDVYLCRATDGVGTPADILLRNDLARSGEFVDVTADVGLDQIAFETHDAAWCDVDGDGDLDLAIGGESVAGPGVAIFEQTGPASGFQPVYPPAQPTWTESVRALVWGDLDGTAGLDLAVATLDGEIALFPGGDLESDPTTLVASTTEPADLTVLDYEYDGDLDLLVSPLADGAAPAILQNQAGTYSEVGSTTGLVAMTGAATAGYLADLNDDGGDDLFLGRAQDTARFLAVGSEPPTGAWVGIRLVDDSYDGCPPVGAQVTVQTGASHTVVLPAGSGGNTAGDGAIRLGLEPGFASPACTVAWPSGHVSTVDLSQHLGEVTTILHQDGFATGLAFGTIKATTEVHPEARIDYVFRWQTTKQTDPLQDKVTLGNTELTWQTADVQVRQWFDIISGAPVYRHELRLNDQPCTVANHSYTVTSGRGATAITSDPQTLNVKFCTSDPDPQL